MDDSIKKTSVPNQMLYSTFNQDAALFAIGTERGFVIYNSYPYKDAFKRDLEGGIGIIEMLNRCNVLALVGGGASPKFSTNKLILWNDAKGEVLSELRFSKDVLNVKLKRNKIFVVTDNKIYVFGFLSIDNIDTLDTYENRKGIIGIAGDSSVEIIAFPDKEMGNVAVRNYGNNSTQTIKAHKSDIGILSMNFDGTLLATASEKGTLIRIYKTSDGSQIQELRRGSKQAEICSISFDKDNRYLACSSNTGTIHVFKIKNDNLDNTGEAQNQRSFFGKLTGLVGIKNEYLNSEWSFAQFNINAVKSICAFGPENSIIIITADGKYYQACFDPKNGGECLKLQEHDIVIN